MSGWDDWDADGDASDVRAEQAAPRMSRRQRRIARKRAARAARRDTGQRYVRDLEATPGVAVLALVLVVVAGAIWWTLSRDDDSDAAASHTSSSRSASNAGSGGSTSEAEASAAPIVLDPHAGAEVLPPRSMPTDPPAPAAAADPLAAAAAFAAQACAWPQGESTSGYVERLAPLATPELAAAWQHGSGPRVGCMQLTAQVTGADTAVVQAVQVYADASVPSGLRAYRWSASLTLVAVDGQWLVAA